MFNPDNDVPVQDALAHGGVGHNSGGSSSLRPGVRNVQVDLIKVWPPAEEQATDCDQMALDEAVEALGVGLQRAPVPIRLTTSGEYEAIGKAHLVRAVRLYNENHPDKPVELEIRVLGNVSDEAAFRLLAQDVEQDFTPSSLARGLFFTRAVAEFGSVESAAMVCRVSKAAISKNLDVARCLSIVGAKVQVRRDISQRDATWLMQQVGREKKSEYASVAKNRDIVKAAVRNMEIMPAKKVFAALRSALKAGVPDKARRNVFLVQVAGRDVGTVRARANDRIAIDLSSAGDIPVDDLMAHLGAVIANIRKR